MKSYSLLPIDDNNENEIPEGESYGREETSQKALEDALDGKEKDEYMALYSRVSAIAPIEKEDVQSRLEEMSLSDEEIALLERYYELKELALEKINADKV